jgi:drug/metabolite transporter (DMT)-like permease
MAELATTPASATAPQAASPDPRRALIYAVLVILFVIWSNSFHAVAYFRQRISVSTLDLVTLRYGPVVPFCLVYCLWQWTRCREMLARDGWRVIAAALFTVPGYNLALNWGQGRVPAATASLLIATNPIFTYLLALALLSERVRWSKVVGLALAFLGVYGLVRFQNGQLGGTYLIHALVVLLAPICWALATVISKPVTTRHDPLLFTFAAMGIGSLPFLVTLVLGIGDAHGVLARLTQTGWIALVHLSLGCTIIGFAAWFWALRHLPASSVAAFVFLNPPFTLLFGIVWGTEAFHWSLAVFGAVILAGVALSSGGLQPARRR